MSESDILSVQLWFGAAAIAFLAIAMAAAGWNHRYFVRGMFGIAFLLVCLAVFWRQFRSYIPDRTDDLFAFLANSRIAWFAMFAVCLGIIFLINRARRTSDPILTSSFDFDQNLKQIWNQQFYNETVPLDGIEYVDCFFENVTLRYDGTAWSRLTNVKFSKDKIVQFSSRNPAIMQAMMHMANIKLAGYEIAYTKMRPDQINANTNNPQ